VEPFGYYLPGGAHDQLIEHSELGRGEVGNYRLGRMLIQEPGAVSAIMTPTSIQGSRWPDQSRIRRFHNASMSLSRDCRGD
jgi:hypothetical protein